NSVHPNPASQSFTIDLDMTNSHNVIIRVLDITGRTVLTQNRGKLSAGQHLMRLDTDQLQTGLYIYQVNIDGDVKSGKISISK
ncbi:MAG: T9SS type A sorting domain-containing protein, partial [Taibaiella sp.]|nr:T9SS type A sorting domain-containing protein [Taibaiella sp.]